MVHAARRGEAHRHEARQRHRLQIPAAVRLHPLEHPQARLDRRAPHQVASAGNGVRSERSAPGRSPRAPESRSSRRAAAPNDRTAAAGTPTRMAAARPATSRPIRPRHSSSESARRTSCRCRSAGGARRYRLCSLGTSRARSSERLVRRGLPSQVECGDDQHGRGDVRMALVGIAPAAVVVLMRHQSRLFRARSAARLRHWSRVR